MKSSERKVSVKLAEEKEHLAEATKQIDSISREDRTEMTDKLLGAAADSIYEA